MISLPWASPGVNKVHLMTLEYRDNVIGLNMEPEFAGKRILILQQRRWAMSIGHYLAQKLQAEGCRLAALTLKRTTHEFITSQKEVAYDLIINNDEVMSDPKKYLENEKITLKEICDGLGVDSIWPIVMTLRNHVRSYKDKFYYGFKQNVSDEDIIEYVKATYKYIKIIFNDFKPNFIIAPNFVSLPHIMLELFARQQGVKMLCITDSKIKNLYMFSYDHNDAQTPLVERVKLLNEKRAVSPNAERAKRFIAEFRQNFISPTNSLDLKNKKTWFKRLRGELRPWREIFLWYAKPQKNVLQSTGITPDYRPPSIILRDHFCAKKYKKFMANYNYCKLENIGKYIYFPLQFQPEATIDVIAPYASNQIETARQVAMSLPDDYTLVVKEHPAMVGYRPPSYIEKVDRTPNVKLIDYRIPSEEVLRNAAMVISPNSTSLFEAAMYCKPAIQFGNLGTTLCLPNVFKHTDMTTLSAKIKKTLALDLRSQDYEQKLENFVSAAFDAGFDVDYVGIWEQGAKSKEEIEKFWNIYKKEIISKLFPEI